jgi:hypothetical protein
MGISDPSLADDIDILASELLRQDDPDLLEAFRLMMLKELGI